MKFILAVNPNLNVEFSFKEVLDFVGGDSDVIASVELTAGQFGIHIFTKDACAAVITANKLAVLLGNWNEYAFNENELGVLDARDGKHGVKVTEKAFKRLYSEIDKRRGRNITSSGSTSSAPSTPLTRSSVFRQEVRRASLSEAAIITPPAAANGSVPSGWKPWPFKA